MKTLEIFDPAMCCSTGVCGVAVDPVLVAVRRRSQVGGGTRRRRAALQPWPGAAGLRRQSGRGQGNGSGHGSPARSSPSTATSSRPASTCRAPNWRQKLGLPRLPDGWRRPRPAARPSRAAAVIMALPAVTTRYLFFTGKGGVGKTSLSCATGLALAGAGKRVLIVSTDPASNLDEVLGTPSRFDADRDYRRAGPLRPQHRPRSRGARLPRAHGRALSRHPAGRRHRQHGRAVLRRLHRRDRRLRRVLQTARRSGATTEFDHVIFDTAPTGHTLRLLTLPSAWSGFIASSTGGASCLGPLAGLEKQKALYAATVARLADPAKTTVVLVSRAERSALREAERTRGELAELGVSNLRLAINGVFAAAPGDAIADAMTGAAPRSAGDHACRSGQPAQHRYALPAERRRRARCVADLIRARSCSSGGHCSSRRRSRALKASTGWWTKSPPPAAASS